jgi:hypothetical protein
MEKDFGLSEQESAKLIVDRRMGTFSWTNPKYPIFFSSKFREILTSNTFQAGEFKSWLFLWAGRIKEVLIRK